MEKVYLPTDGFVRDSSGAIVNVDNTALNAYKKRREIEASKANRINTIEQELAEIKMLLRQVLEEKK